MFSIHVERVIHKPIEVVFAALSDHANYQQFKGVEQSRLIKRASPDENGLGAVREIIAAGATLHEEIVGYEPPTFMAYKIIYSKPLPYQHELGEVCLQTCEEGTKVTWRSQGHINVPILGTWYFDKQIQKHGARAFGSILKSIDVA